MFKLILLTNQFVAASHFEAELKYFLQFPWELGGPSSNLISLTYQFIFMPMSLLLLREV